jgi:glycosyltransferase involved in cell wall biosynthesis
LDQPYPGSDRVSPAIENYRNGKIIRKTKTYFTTIVLYIILKFTNRPGTHLTFKIRDLLSVIEAGLKHKGKFDLFIGLESINAIGGILLRKLGKVGNVVYYVSDYSPKRFGNKFINKIYLWLDSFCAKNADFIWDVSTAMHPARIKAGLDPKKSAPVIIVPNALYKNQINAIPYLRRDKYSCVYVGTIGLENGPDIAIKSMKYVVKRFPSAKLHVMGGGGKGFEQKYLESLVLKNKLGNNVVFHGFISDQKLLSNTIKHFQVALAPYKKIPGSIRYYGDATKIRLYMASGLPLVTSEVPPLGREVEKRGASITVDDNDKSFGQAIISIFRDREKGERLARNAYNFAKNNLWENTYENALEKMDL